MQAAGGGAGAIPDSDLSLAEITALLRADGLESCSLIVAIDFTGSNAVSGDRTFQKRDLHTVEPGHPNPYERVLFVVARTLSQFDDDNLIPAFGFGDLSTRDTALFSLAPDGRPCKGLEAVLSRYRQAAPHVDKNGPTSFAPAINKACELVRAEGNAFHVLLIVADGQISEDCEEATRAAILRACAFPLNIIVVGVGDGPWDRMREFDDGLRGLAARARDNFQFVCLEEVLKAAVGKAPARASAAELQRHFDAEFARAALMELPQQWKDCQAMLERPDAAIAVPAVAVKPLPAGVPAPPAAPPAVEEALPITPRTMAELRKP